MRTATTLFLGWSAATVAICNHVPPAAAQTQDSLATSTKRPGLNWVVPYYFDEHRSTNEMAVAPAYGPDLSYVFPEEKCQKLLLKVPNTYIGLYNSSSNQIGVILQIGQLSSQKLFLLGAGDFVTIECNQCGGVIATVPKGAQPTTEDFTMAVLPGQIYEPHYNGSGTRWEIAQHTP